MAKLKIYSFPDDVLRKQAAPIQRVEKEYYKLADDMLETMYEAPGIGLAANQVGVLERIVVIDTDFKIEHPGEDSDEGEEHGDFPKGEEPEEGIIVNRKPRIIINPEIIHREGEIIYCEGCLSVPEYTADVKRSEKIKVQYQDIDGLTKTMSAEGLLAVCLQHELDHLNGKLFIDHLSTIKKQLVKKKLLKLRAQNKEDE